MKELAGPVETVIVRWSTRLDTYHFDTTGKVREIEFDFADRDRDDSWPRRMTYTYDAAGNRIGSLLAHPDGWSLRTVYAYDPVGHMTAKVTAGGNGEFNEATFFLYDDRGEKAQELFFDRAHGFEEKVAYEDQRPKSKYFVQDELNRPTVYYRYDSAGHLVEQTQGSGEQQTRTLFSFDERGNLLTRSSYFHNTLSEMVTHRYEYDPEGNWITDRYISSVYVGGELYISPEKTTDRTLTYYLFSQ